MSYKILLLFIYIAILNCIFDMLFRLFSKNKAKKCFYNCEKCENSDCLSKHCIKERNRIKQM